MGEGTSLMSSAKMDTDCEAVNKQLLCIFRPKLERDLEPRHVLKYLPDWPTVECDAIMTKQSLKERVDCMLEYLLKDTTPLDKQHFTVLTDALDKAGYGPMRNLLLGGDEDYYEFDEFKKVLRILQPSIQKKIVLDMPLLNWLVSLGVLSEEDKDEIRAKLNQGSTSEALYQLIRYLPRRHKDWPERFIKALGKTGNENVVCLLTGTGRNVTGKTLEDFHWSNGADRDPDGQSEYSVESVHCACMEGATSLAERDHVMLLNKNYESLPADTSCNKAEVSHDPEPFHASTPDSEEAETVVVDTPSSCMSDESDGECAPFALDYQSFPTITVDTYMPPPRGLVTTLESLQREALGGNLEEEEEEASVDFRGPSQREEALGYLGSPSRMEVVLDDLSRTSRREDVSVDYRGPSQTEGSMGGVWGASQQDIYPSMTGNPGHPRRQLSVDVRTMVQCSTLVNTADRVAGKAEEILNTKDSLKRLDVPGWKKFHVFDQTDGKTYFECTAYKNHVFCSCPSFKQYYFCEHSLCVAESEGILNGHMCYVIGNQKFGAPRPCRPSGAKGMGTSLNVSTQASVASPRQSGPAGAKVKSASLSVKSTPVEPSLAGPSCRLPAPVARPKQSGPAGAKGKSGSLNVTSTPIGPSLAGPASYMPQDYVARPKQSGPAGAKGKSGSLNVTSTPIGPSLAGPQAYAAWPRQSGPLVKKGRSTSLNNKSTPTAPSPASGTASSVTKSVKRTGRPRPAEPSTTASSTAGSPATGLGREKSSMGDKYTAPSSSAKSTKLPTNIHINDKPFTLCFIQDQRKATECAKCREKFAGRSAPRDIVLSHPEQWLYPSRERKGEMEISSKDKLTTKFYCVKASCILARFPNFDPSAILVPDGVRSRLLEPHARCLRDEINYWC